MFDDLARDRETSAFPASQPREDIEGCVFFSYRQLTFLCLLPICSYYILAGRKRDYRKRLRFPLKLDILLFWVSFLDFFCECLGF